MPICSAISAILAGSEGSGGSGLPQVTEQNLQFRVQMLPRIRTVAVPLDQHWPRLGQLALWHIVFMPREFKIVSVELYLALAGSGLFSQGGSFRRS